MIKVCKILLLCWILFANQLYAADSTWDASRDASPDATVDANQYSSTYSAIVDGSGDSSSDSTGDNLKDGEETGGFVKSSVLLFAVAFAGITVAKKCLRRASSVVFLVSAFLYIASEVALFTRFYHDGKKSLDQFAATEYDEQVGALKEASKQASKASKIALAKSIIQAVVVVGFLAASIISIIETVFDWPKFTGDCFASVHQKTPFLFTWLDAFIPTAYGAGKGGFAGAMLGALGVGAVAGAAITSAMAGTLGTSYAGIMANGFVRAAVYAVFGGIATWSATESGIVSTELKSNAREYDRLANQLSRVTRTTGEIEIGRTGAQRGTQALPGYQAGAVTGGSESELPETSCFEGQGLAENTRLDSDCSCKKTNTCTKVHLPNLTKGRPDIPGGGDLAAAAQSLGRSANAILSGDLSSAKLEQSQTAKFAARLKKHKSSYVKIAQEKNPSLNGPDIKDWDSFERKTESTLISEVDNAFSGLSNKEKEALQNWHRVWPKKTKLNQGQKRKRKNRYPAIFPERRPFLPAEQIRHFNF